MVKHMLCIVGTVIVLSLSSHAQTEPSKTLRAWKFAVFGPGTVIKIDSKMKAFDDLLNMDETAQGYVINYGTAKAIRTRMKLLMKGLAFRKYDTSRLRFVDGPIERKIRTVMLVVPFGAEKPVP